MKLALPPLVDMELWGLKLRLAATGNLSEQRLLLLPQFLDPVERATLRAELRDGDVFFDIGANVGVYSLWVASLGRRIRIEAFEPDPELCARLRANVARNELRQVTIHELALGELAGSCRLVRDAINRGENRLSTGRDAASGVAVPVETLPAMMKRIGIERIDVLKIDVEGHECAVLRPLFDVWPADCWPRLIVTEVGRRLSALTDCAHGRLLASAGYRLRARSRMNAICDRRVVQSGQ